MRVLITERAIMKTTEKLIKTIIIIIIIVMIMTWREEWQIAKEDSFVNNEFESTGLVHYIFRHMQYTSYAFIKLPHVI